MRNLQAAIVVPSIQSKKPSGILLENSEDGILGKGFRPSSSKKEMHVLNIQFDTILVIQNLFT
jgi:hypothetical protein